MGKSLSGMIRLHKWQLDEQRRNLVELEKMRDDLLKKFTDLEEELTQEQDRVANSAMINISYAAYATVVMERRENLEKSLAEINVSVEDMKDQVAESFKELKKYEVVEQREFDRQQAEFNRRQQADLDELSINLHRRKRKLA